MNKRLRLKQDIIIPAGTLLECCDGSVSTFVSGNYDTYHALGKDMAARIIVGDDPGGRLRDSFVEEVEDE